MGPLIEHSRQGSWSACQHRVDLPLADTAYVQAGSGPPIVFLHGLMGYSFCWRKNIDDLGAHFRAIAIDFAGCGFSGGLRSGTYGIESWSRQLEEFLDALSIPKAHLVGGSAGGAVALEFASRCPDRVDRVALVAPVTAFSRRAVRMASFYKFTGLPEPLVRIAVRNLPLLAPWLFRHRYYSNPSRITPETIPGYLEGIRVEYTVPMLRQAIRSWDGDRLARQAFPVRVPVLLVWGDDDKLVPAECATELAAALPNSELSILRGTGHFCYEEVPDEFNRRVRDFLLQDWRTG